MPQILWFDTDGLDGCVHRHKGTKTLRKFVPSCLGGNFEIPIFRRRCGTAVTTGLYNRYKLDVKRQVFPCQGVIGI